MDRGVFEIVDTESLVPTDYLLRKIDAVIQEGYVALSKHACNLVANSANTLISASGALQGFVMNSDNGMDDGENLLRAIGAFYLEYGSNQLFGGNPVIDQDSGLVTKYVYDLTDNWMSSHPAFASAMRAAVSSKAFDTFGEGLEELVSYVGGAGIEWTLQEDVNLNFEEASEEFLSGVLVSLILGGADAVINSIAQSGASGRNYENITAFSADAQLNITVLQQEMQQYEIKMASGDIAEDSKEWTDICDQYMQLQRSLLDKTVREADLDDTSIQAIVDEGLQSESYTDSYLLAKRAQRKLDKGQTLNKEELSALYMANVRAVDIENSFAQDNSMTAVERGTETAQTLPAVKKTDNTTVTVVSEDGAEQTLRIIEMSGDGAFVLEDGTTAKADAVQFTTDTQTALDMVKSFSAKDSAVLFNQYLNIAGTNVPVDGAKVMSNLKDAYLNGVRLANNPKAPDMESAFSQQDVLPYDAFSTSFLQGYGRAVTNNDVASGKAKNSAETIESDADGGIAQASKVGITGKVGFVDSSSLSRDVRRNKRVQNCISVCRAISDALGVRINLIDRSTSKTAYDGAYESDVITLDISKDFDGGKLKTRKMVNILGHELVDHFAAKDTAAFNGIRDFVLDHLSKQQFEERFDDIARKYGWTEKLSKLESGTKAYDELFKQAYDEIVEEITANACGEVLLNNQYVAELVAKDRTLVEKIADWFSNAIHALFGDSNGGYQEALYMRPFLEGLQERFNAALGRVAQSKNAQKNSTQDGAKKWSISPNLKSDLELVLRNTFPKQKSEVYIGETSSFMVQKLFAKKIELLMPPAKAYAAMVSEEQAKKDGRFNQNMNYHNLGVNKLMEALGASEKPIEAFVAEAEPDEPGEKRENRIVLVTDVIHNGSNVVVIEEVDTTGRFRGNTIPANKTITVYDKESIGKQIETAAATGRLLHFEKNRSQQVMNWNGSNPQTSLTKADFNTNIRNFWANVNWKNTYKKGFFSTEHKKTGSEDSAIAIAYKEAQQKKAEQNAKNGKKLSLAAPIEEQVNTSITMKRAKDMIQRAFVIGEIEEWSDGEYRNGDEWLRGVGSDDVAMVIENDYSLQNAYLDKIPGLLNEDFYVTDILDAYQRGTLTIGDSEQLSDEEIMRSVDVDKAPAELRANAREISQKLKPLREQQKLAQRTLQRYPEVWHLVNLEHDTERKARERSRDRGR